MPNDDFNPTLRGNGSSIPGANGNSIPNSSGTVPPAGNAVPRSSIPGGSGSGTVTPPSGGGTVPRSSIPETTAPGEFELPGREPAGAEPTGSPTFGPRNPFPEDDVRAVPLNLGRTLTWHVQPQRQRVRATASYRWPHLARQPYALPGAGTVMADSEHLVRK